MRRIVLLLSILASISLFAEPVKVDENKPIKFFELYGYFAFNHTLLGNLSMNGNNPYLLKDDLEDSTLAFSHIKLHLEPVINVAETLEVHTKFSLFGDRILGADNRTSALFENGITDPTQLRDRDDSNPLLFEGLWANIATPIGEVRVGRMPFHWGLGMMYNDGNNLQSYGPGDYVDRLSLVVPLAQYKIIPAIDFNAEGVMKPYQDHYIDATQDDDAWSVSAMFLKREDDRELFNEKLLREDTLFEFGALVSYSWRKEGAALKTTEKSASGDETSYKPLEGEVLSGALAEGQSYETMNIDAKLWTVDLWLDFYYKNLSFKVEGALQKGRIGTLFPEGESSGKSIDAEMWGLATETTYKYIPETLHLTLFAGFASSDSADGIHGDSYNLPGNAIDRDKMTDREVTNFRFHHYYNFNSMVWREVLGRFTSGYYVSLDAKYFFYDYLSFHGGFTYSSAFKKSNTIGGKGLPIAFEPFLGVEYKDKKGLRAGLNYQLALPLEGLDTEEKDTELLHFLNTYVGFVF